MYAKIVMESQQQQCLLFQQFHQQIKSSTKEKHILISALLISKIPWKSKNCSSDRWCSGAPCMTNSEFLFIRVEGKDGLPVFEVDIVTRTSRCKLQNFWMHRK